MTFIVDYVMFSPAFSYFTTINMKNIPVLNIFTRATSPLFSLFLYFAFRLPYVAFFDKDRELDENELIILLRFLPVGVIPAMFLNLAVGVGAELIGTRLAEEDDRLKRFFMYSLQPLVPLGRMVTTPIRAFQFLRRALERPPEDYFDFEL